ncbi:MAG: type I-MYXAN CRISPR-associated protein Cmx8 [Tolypothrix carrinoi HA7290-LM1]|nr:type I-MYXAN CRISPR-associated protein Cmx8 [Tolypothrix carrinoi HA7290-LM1]
MLMDFQNYQRVGLQVIGFGSKFINLTYKAFAEERYTEKRINNYDREETVELTDKNGKTKQVQRYYYTVTVPEGAFLPDWDKSNDDPNHGIWVKLWRDMLWQIVRGVPATRNPFNFRVNGASYSQDVEAIWAALQQPEKIIGQSGNYYLGATAINPENIPVKDKAIYQFLLHFWVFVTQVYSPTILDKDGLREFAGYALAIPDVANLRRFCSIFQQVLAARESDKWRHLPREAIIDLPEEGALDLLLLLEDRIKREIGGQQLRRLILGIELIHAEKVGNNIKIRSVSYVEPVTKLIDDYRTIKKMYWCPWFRKQRLINLLKNKSESDEQENNLPQIQPWSDFDAVLSRIPRKWLQDSLFRHDAREFFKHEVKIDMKKEIRDDARIIYDVCQHYVLSKLESKYDLKWDKCKGNPKKEEE